LQIKVIVFWSIIILIAFDAFLYTQITLAMQETEKAKQNLTSLNQTLILLRKQEKNLDMKFEIYEKFGLIPIKLEKPLFLDNKTRIYLIIHDSCHHDYYKEVFEEKIPRWVSNVSSGSYEANIYNTADLCRPYENRDVQEAKKMAELLLPIAHMSEIIYTPEVRHLFVFNQYECFVFQFSPWTIEDDKVNSAVQYLESGTVSQGIDKAYENSEKTNSFLYSLSPAYFLALGILQGLNPCLIALICFVLAATIPVKGYKRAIQRVVMITCGVFYTFLITGFLMCTPIFLASFTSVFIIPLALILLLVGIMHIIEAFFDLRNSTLAEQGKSKLPLFRTPKKLKDIVQFAAKQDSLYVDFAVGAVFSLIKLPCVAPILLTLVSSILTDPAIAMTNIFLVNLGAILPMLALGIAACFGLIKFEQFLGIRFKGRIFQRFLVGLVLLLSAIFLFLG
jgi:cytochrome c biogenesis protein CcdA